MSNVHHFQPRKPRTPPSRLPLGKNALAWWLFGAGALAHVALLMAGIRLPLQEMLVLGGVAAGWNLLGSRARY